MAIRVTYTAKDYEPGKVLKRYVRTNGHNFAWCEVGADRRYDLRQGTCIRKDLPAEVIVAAKEREGFAFSYVEWPL